MQDSTGRTKEKNTVWLGGGCGFLSKTVLYPLLGSNAVKVVDNVFKNTLGKNYVVHKHNQRPAGLNWHRMSVSVQSIREAVSYGMGRIEFEEI